MRLESYLDDKYLGKRVLVLGASGFIGRWVSRELCKHNAEAFLIVRDHKSAKPIFSEYAVTGEIIEKDLLHNESLRPFLKEISPSITFNMVGYGVDPSERDEDSAFAINAYLVKSLCEAVSHSKDPHWMGQDIVHIGTALEYGAISGNLAEDSMPNPTTIYGKSKLRGTSILSDFCRRHGIKGLTARLFTVYGPGEHAHRLLPSLFNTIGEGQPLPLTDGRQRRDFEYVEDVATGLLILGAASAAPGEVINVATGKLTAVREFVEIAAKVLNIPFQQLKFGEIPTRKEEMRHHEVTNARLKELTGWTPSPNIEEGIRKTANFYK